MGSPFWYSQGHKWLMSAFFCYFEFRLATNLKSTETRENLSIQIR